VKKQKGGYSQPQEALKPPRLFSGLNQSSRSSGMGMKDLGKFFMVEVAPGSRSPPAPSSAYLRFACFEAMYFDMMYRERVWFDPGRCVELSMVSLRDLPFLLSAFFVLVTVRLPQVVNRELS
jgi:hypothetical protein